ncbi:hypothetical protein M8818_006350 [Zalaria obscura]|uniref:Uncharacterized protein n=1 Tax=Zalaria obscura TaxID=2024903 RepID=A0ACC3S5H2_9PEZI
MEAFSNVQDPINTLTIAAGFAVLVRPSLCQITSGADFTTVCSISAWSGRLPSIPASHEQGAWAMVYCCISHTVQSAYVSRNYGTISSRLACKVRRRGAIQSQRDFSDVRGNRLARHLRLPGREEQGNGSIPQGPSLVSATCEWSPIDAYCRRRGPRQAKADGIPRLLRPGAQGPRSPAAAICRSARQPAQGSQSQVACGEPCRVAELDHFRHHRRPLFRQTVRVSAKPRDARVRSAATRQRQRRCFVLHRDVFPLGEEAGEPCNLQRDDGASPTVQQETQRPDFMTHILAHKDGDNVKTGISQKEINSNAVLMLTAGTETTATAMAAATFLLLKNPETMDKLKKEIRGRFQKHEDINVDAVSQLEYPLAVIHEALRFMPPVAAGFVRKVPKGGETVSGRFIPSENGETSISVTQLATYKSSRNFKDPDKFAPERWLGDERYKDDNRAAFQPFSYGPRNCLGKNLAYAEMRLILAKLVFNFDMELQEESKAWMTNMKIMLLWQKPPMMVKLTPVA